MLVACFLWLAEGYHKFPKDMPLLPRIQLPCHAMPCELLWAAIDFLQSYFYKCICCLGYSWHAMWVAWGCHRSPTNMLQLATAYMCPFSAHRVFFTISVLPLIIFCARASIVYNFKFNLLKRKWPVQKILENLLFSIQFLFPFNGLPPSPFNGSLHCVGFWCILMHSHKDLGSDWHGTA